MTMPRVNSDDTMIDDDGVTMLHHGTPFTGEVVETSMDGTVIRMNTYRDGLEHGPQREWYYEDGLREEYHAVAGQITGVAQEWHENGRPAMRRQYDERGVLRKQETWDENGTPQPAETFEW
jgi:antitoxin component YwqK of YwqJK toxin-antitoxin module